MVDDIPAPTDTQVWHIHLHSGQLETQQGADDGCLEQRAPAAIPRIAVLQQSPSRGAITANYISPPPPSGLFLTCKKEKKGLCPIFVILLCGMQRGGERVQGGRSSLSVWTFVLKRTWSWTRVMVLCGQDYVQFWVRGFVWGLLEEIPDLWGPGISVLWFLGRRGNAGECRCQ